jgi:hypothetical protein
MAVLGEDDLTFTNKSTRYVVFLNPLRKSIFSISGDLVFLISDRLCREWVSPTGYNENTYGVY